LSTSLIVLTGGFDDFYATITAFFQAIAGS
jgi:hypothetical protein